MNRTQLEKVHSINFHFMLTLMSEEEVETALGLMHETRAELCK